MMKIRADQLPGLPLMYVNSIAAVAPNLQGPGGGTRGTTAYWNLQAWFLS